MEMVATPLDLTLHPVGIICLILFVISYALVMSEEYTGIHKSKPVLMAAGAFYAFNDLPNLAEAAVRHNLLEFAELFLFLLVAMVYINALDERKVFERLRIALIQAGFSYRKLFWITGGLAFLLSPIADNLTTSLLMCAVIMALGRGNDRFIAIACVHVVVAANSGGTFSPFGDITTLMVWQKGIVPFQDFFLLVMPSMINWLVPACFMVAAVPGGHPELDADHHPEEEAVLKEGAWTVLALFILTIATAVTYHHFFHLPPVLGMLTGFAYLKAYGYILKVRFIKDYDRQRDPRLFTDIEDERRWQGGKQRHTDRDRRLMSFDIFEYVDRPEWDTLMFFGGVILCVGGLGFLGYLGTVSELLYVVWGATTANILVGILSAMVDNIPVMFAVLTMQPEMSQGQWLLVTLTAGVGGSMLSVGSAAGVALMGQSKGAYTFMSHLRWTPVIALGYAAAIVTHLWVNGDIM